MEQETVPKPKIKLNELTYDQLAKVRVKLTAEIGEIKKALDAAEEKRDRVDVEFLSRFNTEGIKSVRTDSGTPYVLTQTTVFVDDKDTFKNWAISNNALDFLTMTPKKDMVTTYKEQFGELPPGVGLTSKLKVGFKK